MSRKPRPVAAERSSATQRSSAKTVCRQIAVLGCGQIGEALVRGMLSSGFARPQEIRASARRPVRAAQLSAELRIVATTDNRKAARGADVVLLTLKPKMVEPVLEEILPEIKGRNVLFVSVAAAVTTEQIEKKVGRRGVVRAMPNTPAIIGKGITALCSGRHATKEQVEYARSLFSSVGRSVVVEEQHMDAVTGLSGSGPAFVLMVIESLAEGGVRVGLPRDIALELAAQTVIGSGALVLETGEHPAKLKDGVTTPAGCTVDGILQLEEGGLRVALIKAVSHAAVRAGKLAGK